jgi:hypothetical protein
MSNPKFLLSLLICLCFLSPAFAGEEVVPVEATVGGAGHFFTGNLQKDTPIHYGLKLDLEAVISKELIKKHKKKIPKNYRKYAGKLDSVNYSPLPWLPDTLLISPMPTSQVYGAIWSFIGIGTGLGKHAIRLQVGIDLNLAAMYIHSDKDLSTLGKSQSNSTGLSGASANAMTTDQENTTILLRPGLGAEVSLRINLGKSFGISAGWKSHLFIPQKINGGILETGGFSTNANQIWHMGQGFVLLHFTFPYKVRVPG